MSWQIIKYMLNKSLKLFGQLHPGLQNAYVPTSHLTHKQTEQI